MGKKAIIVGATSGIGKELAHVLLEKGYKVGLTGRRKELLEKLQTNSEDFVPSCFDCTDLDAISHLEKLVDMLKGVDLFIFSAGTGDLNELLDHHTEENTNVLNVVAFTRIMVWAFNLFQKQGHGHLVAITSIGGIRGNGIAPAYNASKAYQINYLEGLRQKATKLKMPIFVTDIRPGFVDTAMAKGDKQFWVAEPKKAAIQIFRAIKKKKDRAYITKRWFSIAIILKILPNWAYKRI